MTDKRYQKLAKIINSWSLKVKKGEKVLINAYSFLALPLAEEVYKESLLLGALPKIDLKTDSLDYFYFKNAKQEQLKTKPEIALFLANWADKVVSLVAEKNTYELASINPKKILTKTKILQPVKDIILKKPWVLTYLPTSSLAQSAQISLQEMEDLYFKACLQDYHKMYLKMKKIKEALDKVKEIHIKGEKTDLKLYFEGRNFQICAGTHNIPDGEVFSAPLENKTKGYIYFDFPSLRQGKIVKNVYFEFDKGKVVKFDASENKDYLQESLNIDQGAKRLGEFAFGLNYGLDRFFYNTLFDEKIGGTIHLALGSSYSVKEDGGGLNKSAIHWDFVKDMRKKGSLVLADGKEIFKDGKMLI